MNNKSKHKKTQRVRKGGQLKGTKHRGEMQTYYELLSLLMKNDVGKSELKVRIRSDGKYIKKALEKLSKGAFIQVVNNSQRSKYKITVIGAEFQVYLKNLLG